MTILSTYERLDFDYPDHNAMRWQGGNLVVSFRGALSVDPLYPSPLSRLPDYVPVAIRHHEQERSLLVLLMSGASAMLSPPVLWGAGPDHPLHPARPGAPLAGMGDDPVIADIRREVQDWDGTTRNRVARMILRIDRCHLPGWMLAGGIRASQDLSFEAAPLALTEEDRHHCPSLHAAIRIFVPVAMSSPLEDDLRTPGPSHGEKATWPGHGVPYDASFGAPSGAPPDAEDIGRLIRILQPGMHPLLREWEKLGSVAKALLADREPIALGLYECALLHSCDETMTRLIDEIMETPEALVSARAHSLLPRLAAAALYPYWPGPSTAPEFLETCRRFLELLDRYGQDPEPGFDIGQIRGRYGSYLKQGARGELPARTWQPAPLPGVRSDTQESGQPVREGGGEAPEPGGNEAVAGLTREAANFRVAVVSGDSGTAR